MIKFTIPIGNITREQAEQYIRELMSNLHEDVEWYDTPTIKRKDRRKKI